MVENVFKDIKRYPVIFIGSGISKRFLDDYPNWNQLLELYWDQLDQDMPFYNYLLTLKKELEPIVLPDELDHKINTKAAEFIENTYNNKFYEGKILIEGLSPEQVYKDDISPFKYSIC